MVSEKKNVKQIYSLYKEMELNTFFYPLEIFNYDE